MKNEEEDRSARINDERKKHGGIEEELTTWKEGRKEGREGWMNGRIER
jgi:hypothetical protein